MVLDDPPPTTGGTQPKISWIRGHQGQELDKDDPVHSRPTLVVREDDLDQTDVDPTLDPSDTGPHGRAWGGEPWVGEPREEETGPVDRQAAPRGLTPAPDGAEPEDLSALAKRIAREGAAHAPTEPDAGASRTTPDLGPNPSMMDDLDAISGLSDDTPAVFHEAPDGPLDALPADQLVPDQETMVLDPEEWGRGAGAAGQTSRVSEPRAPTTRDSEARRADTLPPWLSWGLLVLGLVLLGVALGLLLSYMGS